MTATKLLGKLVRLVDARGRPSSPPLRVVGEHRCAAALGEGVRHVPAVELLCPDGQILFAYRHEVRPIYQWLCS